MQKLYQADPSLQNDYKLIYQQTVNMVMALQHEAAHKRLQFIPSVPENMNVKILVRGNQYSQNPVAEPEYIRVEFTS